MVLIDTHHARAVAAGDPPTCRRLFPPLLYVCIFIFAGCQGPNGVRFSVSYRAPALGIGGGIVTDQVTISPGRQPEVASRAIIKALQGMQLSVVSPDLSKSMGKEIPQRKPVVTDYVPVSSAMIRKHNSLFPELTLPDDRRYSLGFNLQYAVEANTLDFTVSALIQEQAVGGRARVCKSPYSGAFFVGNLQERISRFLATDN